MIDSHAHVFERGLSLAPKRRYAPDYDATTDQYLKQLDRHGIACGILIQPSFLGVDHTYLLSALRAAPTRLRGVVVLEPACPEEEMMALDQAGVTGTRLNLIGLPDQPLNQYLTPQTLTRLLHLEWHIEVHAEASRLRGIVTPLLAQGLTVVVDHFGRPSPELGSRDPGFRELLSMAAAPRLYVKLSAPYRNWNLRTAAGQSDMHRTTAALLDAFTPARLMWGSDWPHTQFETSENFEQAVSNILDLNLSEEERASVMSETACRFYRFDETA